MRTTAPGERVLQSIEVYNPTHKRQTFEVVLPNPLVSWIKIAPYIVDLAPQQRQRLEVEYLPPSGLTRVSPIEWLDRVNRAVNNPTTTSNASLDLTAGTAGGSGLGAEEGSSEMKQGSDNFPAGAHNGYGAFSEWEEADGWVWAKGDFGEIQWVNPRNLAVIGEGRVEYSG